MKRISIFALVIFMMATNITKGYSPYYHSSYRRVRWSFHAHGLVPGELRYNPYARGYGRTGLVPYWVRYSPYAHGIKHPSGLVNDYACSTESIYYRPEKVIYRASCPMDAILSRAAEDSGHKRAEIKKTRENHLAQIKARREEIRQLAQSRKQERLTNRSPGKEAIVAYLKDNNIDFRMNRLLSIEGKVLSADFIIGDGNTVISYWDPTEIQALGAQAGHRASLYQNYVNSWKNFCLEYQRAGGEIFQIVSSDREDILAQLTLRDQPGENQTTFAMAQSQDKP